MPEGSTVQREKVALVTGASRGLGRAIAERLAVDQFHVVATARTEGALAELAGIVSQAGGQATYVAADITSSAGMRELCRSIYDNWGRLDVLVHAAVHAPPLSPVAHGDIRDFRMALEINCIATFELITLVTPLLNQAGSARAVFFEDDRAGCKFFGAYGGTKAMQIALARSWQKETGKNSGLRVVVLEPRPMATETRRRFFPGEDRSRLVTPEAEADRLYHLLVAGIVPADDRP